MGDDHPSTEHSGASTAPQLAEAQVESTIDAGRPAIGLWLWPVVSIVTIAVAGQIAGAVAAVLVTAALIAIASAQVLYIGLQARWRTAAAPLSTVVALVILALAYFWVHSNEVDSALPSARASVRPGPSESASPHGLDLSGSDLSGADLAGADLSHADLSGALLIRADLRGADLAGACLDGADLTGARIDGVEAAGASVAGTIVGADQTDRAETWPTESGDRTACG